MLVFDDVTAHHIFVFQEEQLQSNEREKLSKNRELADAQEQLRQKVSIDIVTTSLGHHVSCHAGDRADNNGSRGDKKRSRDDIKGSGIDKK